MSAPNAVRHGIKGRTLAVIAAGAALVLVASLFAVRAMTQSSAPSAPSGLTLSMEGTAVKAVWNSVSGADEYTLVRDDDVVVYTGSDTSAVDRSARTGKHSYRVRAADGGAESSDSAPAEFTVEAGWGTGVQRLVDMFPRVLPESPTTTGFDDISCRSLVQGTSGEMGAGDRGSDKPLVERRVHCFTPTVALQVTLATSKESADALLSEASKKPSAESVTWRYGTGYVVEQTGIAYLRPDTHDDVVIVMRIDDADKEKLLEFANTLPLE
ncbi:hypothetical protein [Gordonia shandongensis]|uniref:hypothetical protein n=1 Tax=Gordonia shandongensis TaxID=376351 RepID=UPI0004792C7D|nr:hypothetical protein [Gordonia shandongensis]